jgi:hypothetical protein
VIDLRDHLTDVPHLLLVVLHHRVHNLATNVQHVAVAMIARVHRVKFPRVVKSAIHAGFDQLRKSATNREFVLVSSNQISLKMSQGRS